MRKGDGGQLKEKLKPHFTNWKKKVISMTESHLSSAECVTWTVLLIIECVAIVTLNFLAIVVFIKNRELRKRSTYLLINLAFADMMTGAATGTNDVYELGVSCDFWFYKVEKPPSSPVIYGIYAFFPSASLVNITIISLERLHATFYPLRHLVVVKKRVYGAVIFTGWAIVSIIVTGAVVSSRIVILHICVPIFLFVIVISYILIFIKVRFSPQPQHHGAAGRERKLTVTLVIVTAVSLLMWLPFVIRRLLENTDIYQSLSYWVHMRIYYVVDMLFFGNSLVNPVLYAIRMPDFKKALVGIFCKTKPPIVNPEFVLRNM
ncbi:hypothetical protein ACROYT_G017284 [Oculina patagonica]